MIHSGRFGFVGRRLLQAIPLTLVLLLLVFAMLKVVPGDPAMQVAGPRASAATLQAIRVQLGLDQPVWEQFLHYLGRIATGDFGTTATGSTKVGTLIASGAPVTLVLLAVSTVFTVLIAGATALLAARRPDGLVDRMINVMAAFGVGVPTFWLGIVLLAGVALPTGAFPIGGWGDTPATVLRAAVLPALALSVSVAPVLMASLRSGIVEARRSEYHAAAQAAGVRGWKLTRGFVLRNAAVPPVSLLAALTTLLLSGAVVVESTFGLPGLGLSLTQAAQNRDFNVIQGLTLVFSLAVVVVNLVGDVLVAFLDPRVMV
ncbi:peptide ABC transporter permease [Acrocarpospora corrugata]|uniref:Peptide ABC transporter permease n=1 Tax=Acrocarpospora corrugata TaxID=35763 RepID=A0A5M3VTK1_9ACTN|nr:ABC transporter permease [Acrocarpospora corrugata]GER99548.1 peptide ABC transporter permease [Acrocarpospora corrugata]